MADREEHDGDRRRTTRPVLWSLSLLWAGACLAGGIGSGLDPAYDQTLASGLVVGLVFGVLPCVPFWIAQARAFRLRRRAERLRAQREAQIDARTASARQHRERIEKLPLAVRNGWERLERSRLLVQEFADDGWIEQTAIAEVDGHIAMLHKLLEADERTARLGGAPSATLHAQVGHLTDLLVALADSAVEHQAALITGDPVPVTLAEARDRLSTTAEAYRDLQQPG